MRKELRIARWRAIRYGAGVFTGKGGSVSAFLRAAFGSIRKILRVASISQTGFFGPASAPGPMRKGLRVARWYTVR